MSLRLRKYYEYCLKENKSFIHALYYKICLKLTNYERQYFETYDFIRSALWALSIALIIRSCAYQPLTFHLNRCCQT